MQNAFDAVSKTKGRTHPNDTIFLEFVGLENITRGLREKNAQNEVVKVPGCAFAGNCHVSPCQGQENYRH
jgi:hypothetical protein